MKKIFIMSLVAILGLIVMGVVGISSSNASNIVNASLSDCFEYEYVGKIRYKKIRLDLYEGNLMHEHAIKLSVTKKTKNEDEYNQVNLPVYCLNVNKTTDAGVRTVKNIVVDEQDGTGSWYYTNIGSLKIKDGEVTETTEAYYGSYSLTQIRQMQYIIGAGETSGKSLSKESWKLSRQIALWMVSINGATYWDNESIKFGGYKDEDEAKASINYLAERFGVNDSEKEDVRKNTLNLYNSAVKYAEAMENYGTMEKSPSISVDKSASIYSTGETYKIGPFTLDYNTKSVRIIEEKEELEVTGDAGQVTLDSNYYEYSTGSRGTTLPKSGEQFYIHVKNLGSTSKITKVSIKYKYESYDKIDLYETLLGDTQPVLITERSTL